MKKKILKFVSRFFARPIVRVSIYIFSIILIFYFYGVFDSFNRSFVEVLRRILNVFTSEDTLSVFLAAIFSISLAKFIKRCDYYLEESMKIDDNHHKIISIYSGHEKSDETEILASGENYYNKNGSFMLLNSDHISVFSRRDLNNHVKDKYSKKYEDVQQDINDFDRGFGRLYLPSLNVFANIKGDTKLLFNDSKDVFQLPDFVMQNARNLLAAHKNSKRTNNSTVRLTDFSYSNGTLTLDTQRSMYFHMLITNRCMDYEFDEGLTVRTVYEYNKTVSPLNKSVFGNQIGINGLILSSDGYVLIEKRDHNKITWKNKFAQSISLALKVSDLKLGENATIGSSSEVANSKFKSIIEKTVKDNFGLIPDDYDEFCVENNFLGIARDLLEGGKPNMYFYLTTKCNAEELVQLLEKNAARSVPENGLKPLQTSKLSSDYYLVPYEDLCINFNYSMKVNRRNSAYWIHRRIFPRETRINHFADRLRHKTERFFSPVIKRECGEAFLVTLSYLELCKNRIEAIKNK